MYITTIVNNIFLGISRRLGVVVVKKTILLGLCMVFSGVLVRCNNPTKSSANKDGSSSSSKETTELTTSIKETKETTTEQSSTVQDTKETVGSSEQKRRASN